MNTEQRRLILRLLTKLLLLGFIIGLIFVFMRSLPGSGLQKKQDRVDLGQLQTGQALLYDWNGKRVLILKRDMIGLSGLRQLDDELLDPYSHHSRQPTATKNFLRSLRAEYFIVLDYGTDLNCGLNYLPHSHTGPKGRMWLGGFKDQCRGSWYDLSGRVYKGQEAKRNLTIPLYTIENQTLILGTE